MNKERNKFYLVLGGAILFNLLFWNEKMGLNILFYDFFLLAVLFFLYPNAKQSSTVRWLLLGHLTCLAMVLLHNSGLSKFATGTTLLLLTAYIQYQHRSAWYAGGTVLQNALFFLPSLVDSYGPRAVKRKSGLKVSKWMRFAILPLLMALLFFGVYSIANSVFFDISSRAMNKFLRYFDNFFRYFSWQRFLFFLAGIAITALILLRSKLSYFHDKEKSERDNLLRNRNKKERRNLNVVEDLFAGVLGRFANGMVALKNANNVGLLSLVLLNILLLVVNSIDISYIWFGFKPMEVSFYEVIHEGAGLLIFSIILAILVLLLFFRGNLNFYQGNKWLKRTAYLWIAQNLVLVVSVFLRDYHYIKMAGLGRYRIGILFYLALVLFGLISVFWKIYRNKTTYFLFRINAWAAIVLLIAVTTVNWDLAIVNYNLSRKDDIVMPVPYMVSLSDAVLPVLDKNRDELKRHEALMKTYGFWDRRECEGCWQLNLDKRIAAYKEEQAGFSWLSWNRTDAAIREYFLLNAVKK